MLSMVLGFLNIGTSEMLLIVFVALLLFGGKKLPELARGLGRGIREFKDASETIKRDISEQINNFEKDVDVKELIVDDVEKEIKSAEKSPETPTEQERKEETKANDPHVAKPVFPAGAPAGTYQHNPGREPDYVGSQDVYYSDNNQEPLPVEQGERTNTSTHHSENPELTAPKQDTGDSQ